MSRKMSQVLDLECQLTPSERLNYAKELGDLIASKMRAEESLKSFSTQKKAEIAEKVARINSLADKLNTGREVRPIMCRIDWNWTERTKEFYRIDTGEFAKVEPIQEGERQESME